MLRLIKQHSLDKSQIVRCCFNSLEGNSIPSWFDSHCCCHISQINVKTRRNRNRNRKPIHSSSSKNCIPVESFDVKRNCLIGTEAWQHVAWAMKSNGELNNLYTKTTRLFDLISDCCCSPAVESPIFQPHAWLRQLLKQH